MGLWLLNYSLLFMHVFDLRSVPKTSLPPNIHFTRLWWTPEILPLKWLILNFFRLQTQLKNLAKGIDPLTRKNTHAIKFALQFE